MSKIINCLSVLDNNKKKFTFPFDFRWTPIIIFNVFFALLIMQPMAWAGLSNLSVDANGDSIFNGVNEKLTITFSTSDFGDETQSYDYMVLVDGREEPIFTQETGFKPSKNQSVSLEWDGKVPRGEGNREQLPDGDYTIRVELTVSTGAAFTPGLVVELETDVTIDTKAPELSIDVGFNEFSPVLDSLPVYYSIDEEVRESKLLFQRSPGDASTGRPISLSTSSGSHTYDWDGDDSGRRTFDDGKYTLKLSVIDKGGNEATSSKTEEITIDTEEPRITGIFLNGSISLVDGLFTNSTIQTISFSADAEGGTPLDVNSRDTEVTIRPIGGRNINGSLTYGNQPSFSLGNPLDELAENGGYEVTVFIADRVGNVASDRVKFTFDNDQPILKSVSTDKGQLTPGTGISGRTNYVEAVLEDNIQLNLAGSLIRLRGPDGSIILGKQSQHNNEKIRWELLSPLLPQDGLQDGQYTIEIVGKDRAENDTSTIQISFLYDNLAPELVSLKPSRDGEPFNFLGDTVYYNTPINQFVATFSDGEFGTGVVFTGSENSRIVFGREKEDGEITVKSGRAFPDINNDVLTFILNTPLIKTDGSQDGEYVLNVKVIDKLGNTDTYSHRFVFDTQLPTLRSTLPAANQTVSNLSEVVVKLNEVTSGIDFAQSNFQLNRSDGENQVDVPVNIQTNGTDTATLTLLQPIALDGSDDGTYTIEVTPTDMAGNTGAVVRRQFYLVSQTQPKVKLTTPETGTVSSLGDIIVEIENYIGSGINFDVSTIIVRNAQGIVLPQAKVEADEANNQLTWSTEAAIPRNGTADGEYTVSVVFVDFSGQFYTEQFPFVLDTQFPKINTVSVGTDPQLNLTINTATDISETFSQISVEFDGQDIDFEDTVVSLTGPDATEIPIHRSDDGNTHLTLDFQNLAQLGTYTLTVTPIDRIGNVSVTPFVYRFNLDIDVPVVTAVLIGGQSGAVVYVDGSASDIIATLTDSTGTGLALGEGESRIVVTAESGLPVPGITTSKDDNQLIWRPIALPMDGSADGRYIVAITPVDKAGRTGDVVYRSFIFDTQAPRISASSPVTLHQPISYIGGSLTQFQFTVEDIGPALLDLDVQAIGIENKDGETVPGQITHDGINQIFYTLSAPLPTDGSADGEYILTVTLVDQAGNSSQVEHNIFYDSQAPHLSSVSLSTNTPLDLTPYQVTDFSESISELTLNFVEMTRVDFTNTGVSLIGPDGSSIPLSLENNGVDQVILSFVSLTQEGLYTLSITPQDIVGNTAQGAVLYPFELKFEIPGLSSVIANTATTSIELIQHENIEISETINSLVLRFTDASRIDFENTQVMLTDINGQEVPITKEKNVDAELVVRFVSLMQNGLYVFTVTPQDRLGNRSQAANRYQFQLDISLPTVNSVLIDGKSSATIYVNDSDFSIVATFIDPPGVGLAFGDDGSNIVVTNANGLTILGITKSNGTDQIDWVTTALPSDGTADGRYTVAITPIDKVGRIGKVVNQEFIYDTQAPRITSSSPATLHQPISYIGGSLTQLQFSIEDIGPASFDIDLQTISLNQMDGEPVQGETTHDGTNQLFFTLSTPLPTDGSADGKYTLNVTLVDKAGNVYQTEHDIFYDSQAPQISSVTVKTQTPLDLTPYQVTNLSETINEVSLKFDETTRVDFSNTTVTLMGPENSAIPLTLKNNGVDQLTASFVSLTRGGLYTLSVTPQDIAGNTAQGAVLYPFRLKFGVPGLSSVVANTTVGSVELISYETVDISESVSSFTLVFTDSSRIDFENTDVSLTGPNGQEIQVTREGDDSEFVVRFVSLSQNGMYTLSVTPQDVSGNTVQGSVLYPFRLKSGVPGLTSVVANTTEDSVVLTAYESVDISESVSSFTLVFTDSSRIDFENTNVSLTGPNGQEIQVTREGDDSEFVVRFVSLTQNGLYTLSVTPQDISGNTAQGAVLYPFDLKFEVSAIASVKASTENASVELIQHDVVEFSDSVNNLTLEFLDASQIDFENTEVLLTGPNGEGIALTTEEDEASQLVVRFVPLIEDGVYTLSVTPQDITGNVAQEAVLYPFRLKFGVPGLTSVVANTTEDSVVLTAYESVDISESINSFTVVFTDSNRIDFENTSVSLRGDNGQDIPVSLEVDGTQLNVRFVALRQSGMYTLSITPQDIAGNTAQGAVLYPFRLEFQAPQIVSVRSNVGPSSVSFTPYETVDISQSINSFTILFSDISRIDFENTNVSLTGPNGQEIQVTREGDDSEFVVRFVSLTQNGMYTLSVTPQDISGNTVQGAVLYPFRLKFGVPGLTSVVANTTVGSVELISYETVDISESVSSFTLVFTDSSRIDFENTNVSLTGPNGQEIQVTREGDDSEFVVRFVSLSQNGLYTLSVTPQDITGNVAQEVVLYPFRLKSGVPGLTSVVANTTEDSVVLTAYETVDISESVSSFTLVFTDSSRIDFENTNVSLTGPNGQEIQVTREGDDSEFVVRFVSLTQNGLYTLSVTPQDISGNTAQGAVLYPFDLKFEVSAIASVKASTENASVELIQHDVVEFSDSVNNLTLEFLDASQIDFENTEVLLTGPNGEGIALTTEEDEASQLVVRFVPLIEDGVYTLSVTPQDITGNVAQEAVLYPFRLKFGVPGLTSVVANTTEDSVVLTAYESVDISESINSFTVVFTDSNRIDFENTNVSLRDDNGQDIPVSLEVDGTQLNVRFVSLTQSGMYTLSITPQDIAGNTAQGAVLYPFDLKFEVSAIASVKASTENASVELIQHDVVEFSDSVNNLTLEFLDASQIDFENTDVLLTGPNGEGIALTTEEDEASQLVVRFVPLIEDGVYTLLVTPQDITGNVAKNAARYQFRLVFPLPSVSSVLIDGKPGSTVYVSKSIPIIIATFSDNNGIALSLEEDGSTIVVTNPEGTLVSGVTTSNGSDQLTWRPTPLPTDGSSDGKYAVTITPVDKSGRTGTVVNQQFIYDSQAPRITSATPLTIYAPVSYIGGGLSQFVINIEDVGPAGIVLASQVAALQDSTGNSISANLTYDEIAGQLYLTLTQPFANDGSMDGTYTLNVLLIDKAGNRLNSRFKIIYDSKMPQVSSVTANTVGNPTELVPNQVTDISESISTIIVKFAEATLVDFANTTVSLLDPDDITIPIALEDDGVSQLTLNFVGLTQIGQYTLTLIPQDVAGNTAQNPIEYPFILEFILPEIESIVIGDTITLGSGDIAYVNADNLRIIANFLDPAETGLSFDVTTGSDILVATLDNTNTIVPGSTATNGTDLLVWEPVTLSTDGSSDGRYAVYVTPVDKKGRSGNTAYREFIYDTQEPEITSADPINLSQPVSYMSDSLTQLSFTLQDVGPADIILDDQKVSLRNQSGVLIPTQLTHDSNNQFYLTLDEPLPLDGSRDGEYTVVTAFSDKAGNVLAIEHPIVYDTQAPTLVSTVPANGAQLTEDVTQIQVNLNDEGDSGIDWTLTTVTLVDPNKETISGELTSNGRTQLTLHTNQLVADGRYVIQVRAIDRAGNGSNSVFESSFLLSRRLPAVLSTLPTTAPAEEAYTNEEVDQVEVRLETADENHLSTLRLLNADGQVVAGQQQRSSGRLVYTLIRPLATDGSEDGIYTIEFTPISASGRSGEVQQLTFTYDTQVPEIESEAITLVVSEPEVNNSLIEIQVAITDNQSGIDWENLDEDWINFERVSPNATEIEGRVSFDEQDNLIFRLTVPLADNGSADGKYRIEVTPIDQAGNGDETYEKVFTYDTSPPVIDPNSLLLNDLPLLTDITAEDYPSAISTTGGVVVQASVTDTGLGVNLSQSRIIIINPNGQEVSGTTHQNGVDTIIFKSDGLPVEGIYQVNVTGIGNDSELLGFAPKGSITTEFLYETTEPTGVVTDDGGKTELTDEPIPFQGTANDPQGVRRVPPQQGEGEIPIPASGVWLVEIVGTGPDGQPIEPVPAEDESDAQEQPWSSWTADFLPTRSGEYDLDLRVTDKAGNFAVYDIGEYTMSVSFSFSGNTFGWPNPLRHSKSDVAFFSFDLNAAAEENVEMVLYIYDWGGDLVYSKTYTDIIPGERSDTHIKWNLENQSGTPVARGLYVFRLEAVNGAGNRANAVGKILVVD